MGSGYGLVGRAVASVPEIRGSNPVIGKIYIEHLLTVNYIEKTKINKNCPFRYRKLLVGDESAHITTRPRLWPLTTAIALEFVPPV